MRAARNCHDGRWGMHARRIESSALRVCGYVLRTLSVASKIAVANVLMKFPLGTYKDAEQTHVVQTKFDGVPYIKPYIKLEASGRCITKLGRDSKSLEISE
jgi:hypothetical protein